MGELLPFGRRNKRIVIQDEWPGFSLSLTPADTDKERAMCMPFSDYKSALAVARNAVRDYPQCFVGIIDRTGLDKRIDARAKFMPILEAAKEIEGFNRILDRCQTRSDQKALIIAAHSYGAITHDECGALISARMLETD